METAEENSVDNDNKLRNLLQLLIVDATRVEKRELPAIGSHDLVVAEKSAQATQAVDKQCSSRYQSV